MNLNQKDVNLCENFTKLIRQFQEYFFIQITTLANEYISGSIRNKERVSERE